jgi:uncharacterized protein YybS (DUF2232 family)
VLILNQKVSLIETLLAILIVFVFITLTNISVIVGAFILPFVVLYLLKLKHKSNYQFWLIFISFMIPAILFLEPSILLWFVLLYILTAVIHSTLVKGASQELTLFYVTFTISLGAIGGLSLLQAVGLIQPLSEIYFSFRNWYVEQLESLGSMPFGVVDIDIFKEALDQFYINLPGYITIFSFFIALYVVLMLRITINKDQLKPWPRRAFSDWQLPRATLYLFLVIFVVSFFTTGGDGTFQTLISNLLLISEWAIFIHGLAFCYFFFLEKKMHKALAVILLIPLFIFRPITLLIGLFEMMFRLRMILIMKRK